MTESVETGSDACRHFRIRGRGDQGVGNQTRILQKIIASTE